MKLEEQIRRVDGGIHWAEFKSEQARRTFIDSEDVHILPILSYVRAHSKLDRLTMADLGGANGRVSKKILDGLGQQYPNFSIDVLDIDESKFPKDSQLHFVKHDAKTELDRKYSVVLARFLLHYNPYQEQQDICNKIYRGLDTPGLACIIDAVPVNEDERQKLNLAHELIANMVGCNKKYWNLKQEMAQFVEKSGLNIVSIQESDPLPYGAEAYFKARNGLSDEQTRELNDVLGGKPVYARTTIICGAK